MRVLVRVSGKRRVTIPKEVSELLGIEEGDYLVFTVEGRRIIVEKADPLDLLEKLLAGETGKGVAEEIDLDRRRSER